MSLILFLIEVVQMRIAYIADHNMENISTKELAACPQYDFTSIDLSFSNKARVTDLQNT